MVGQWKALAILGLFSISHLAFANGDKGVPFNDQNLAQPRLHPLIELEKLAEAAEGNRPLALPVTDELKSSVEFIQSNAAVPSAEELAKIRKAIEAKKAAKAAAAAVKLKPTVLAAEYSANVGDAATEVTGIDTMIKIGEKLWHVIQEGKPVANITTQKVHVVPNQQQEWSKMENWKGPATCKFALELKNVFGWTLISHSYTIVFNYGGQLDGKGQYLANVTVMPDANVPLFFNLESNVEIGDPVNMGTKASPMPGLPIRINWRASQVPARLNDRPGTIAAFIRGDGSCVQLTQ